MATKKLRPSLRALIDADKPTDALDQECLRTLLDGIAGDQVEPRRRHAWPVVVISVLVTLNRATAIAGLWKWHAEQGLPDDELQERAALLRETAFKLAPLTGLPRTIVAGTALHDAMSEDIRAAFPSDKRRLTTESVDAMEERSQARFRHLYGDFADRTIARMQQAHPALPTWALTGGYGILSDESVLDGGLTSIMTIAALRTIERQPAQLLSHCFGLLTWPGWTEDDAEWAIRLADRVRHAPLYAK